MEQVDKKQTKCAPKNQRGEKNKRIFTKQALLCSRAFAASRDALRICLREDTCYTTEQAEKILNGFMKGKV